MDDTAEGRRRSQQQQQQQLAPVAAAATTSPPFGETSAVKAASCVGGGGGGEKQKPAATLLPLTTKAETLKEEEERRRLLLEGGSSKKAASVVLSRGDASHVKGSESSSLSIIENSKSAADSTEEQKENNLQLSSPSVTITKVVELTSKPERPSSSSSAATAAAALSSIIKMTVSSGLKDEEVGSGSGDDGYGGGDMSASASPPRQPRHLSSKMEEGDDNSPMNLSPDNGNASLIEEEEQAMNLSNKPSSAAPSPPAVSIAPVVPVRNSSGIAMCAKMRLKKQRLLAAEQALKKSKLSSDVSNGNADIHMTSLPQHEQNSALHRLAEAAERKQEEEMMEIESSSNTPRGTPTPSNTPPACIRNPPPRALLNSVLTPQLAPNTEYEVSSSSSQATPTASPLTARHYSKLVGGANAPAPTPSPDSAIHSAYYSPSQSPVQSRHIVGSGFSSPFSLRTTPSLSRNNSDASQYGGSQYSYSSNTSPLSPQQQFSPSHSPVQGRHPPPAHGASPFPNVGGAGLPSSPLPPARHLSLPMYPHGVMMRAQEEAAAAALRRASPISETSVEGDDKAAAATAQQSAGGAQQQAAGISRQQLINSPCPVCGDKISGFHYGIFSCESCKGFFKRTVQNKKNYVCLRGAACPVTIATRKKCPACRFDKCLKTGMKLEAIREDRTRGGRSTYQCSYTLPAGLTPASANAAAMPPTSAAPPQPSSLPPGLPSVPLPMKLQQQTSSSSSSPETTTASPDSQNQELAMDQGSASSIASREASSSPRSDGDNNSRVPKTGVPALLQEIMDVEHLWFSSKPVGDLCSSRLSRHTNLPAPPPAASSVSSSGGEDMVQTLTVMADKRLFKLVKWCKSLPLFKNILIDDQIALLINAWCELLVFSCCFRSVGSPGVIRVSAESSLTLELARAHGVEKCVEKMLNFTDQLRRLKVDYYEYVSMKVIVLLTSDASGLKEPEHVRDSQEKVVQALQQYTAANYPDMPSKFGELLLRMPELQRVCQVGKEVLCPRQPEDGEVAGFNLLMELLRGDH